MCERLSIDSARSVTNRQCVCGGVPSSRIAARMALNKTALFGEYTKNPSRATAASPDLHVVPVLEPINGFRCRQWNFGVAAADPALSTSIMNVQADGSRSVMLCRNSFHLIGVLVTSMEQYRSAHGQYSSRHLTRQHTHE